MARHEPELSMLNSLGDRVVFGATRNGGIVTVPLLLPPLVKGGAEGAGRTMGAREDDWGHSHMTSPKRSVFLPPTPCHCHDHTTY